MTEGFEDVAKAADGINVEQLGLVGAGAAVVVLSLRMMAGLVKRDSEERAELRSEAKLAREERITVAQKLGELETRWRDCEAHRQEQDREIARLDAELHEVRRNQAERLNREIP